MPITVNWDDDQQTVIRLDYADPIKAWLEYVEAVRELYALASASLIAWTLSTPPGAPECRRIGAALAASRLQGHPAEYRPDGGDHRRSVRRLIVPLVYKTLPNSEKLSTSARSIRRAR